MPKPQALIITCKAMAPFVDVPLLQTQNDGTLVPSDDAPNTEIDAVLKRLEQMDDEYDLHSIPNILDSLMKGSWDAGYSLKMGVQQLLDDSQVETVGDLTAEVSRRSIQV
jgi:hypothetical protein